MNVNDFLEITSRKLKFDYDGTNPQWFLLAHIFNLLYYYPDAKIYLSSSRKGFHVVVEDSESNLDIRRFHREDKGRLWCTELRSLMLGAKENHDIIYKAKGRFKFIKVRGKWIHVWVKEPIGDEAISVEDLLRLPSKLAPPQHKKRYLKWWKKKSWKLNKIRKFRPGDILRK